MKIVLEGSQRRILFQQNYLELEEVFAKEAVDKLFVQVANTLEKHGKKGATPEELYRVGRDLWRDNEAIKNFCCAARMADLGRGALDLRSALLGFDQLLTPPEYPFYAETFSEETPLEELTSFQGLKLLLLVCLKGEREVDDSPFPHAPGNVTILLPKATLPWQLLDKEMQQKFLLVGLAEEEAVYFPSKKDPAAHKPKQKGYVVGDRLLNHGHPKLIK